jgi:hypothetical protein
MPTNSVSIDQQIQKYTTLTANNSPSLVTNYFKLQASNPYNYTKTNTSGLQNVVNATNQKLTQLNLYGNQLNALNNLNNEAIVKKDQLLKLENDDLTKQLFQLENLQSTISNKNRMIEQVNKNIEDTDNNIKMLIIVIILTILFLFAIIAYGMKKIDGNVLLFAFCIILFSFFMSNIYVNNLFSFKNAVHNTFKNNDKRLINAVKAIDAVKDTLKEETTDVINKIKKNYLKDYCGCDDKDNENVSEEITTITKTTTTTGMGGIPGMPGNTGSISEDSTPAVSYGNSSGPNIASQLIGSEHSGSPGYFYYDGSSPQQLLSPNPSIYVKNQNKNLPSIDWLDYSGNGNVLFNPDLTTQKLNVSYDTSNRYNSNIKTDPTILQKNILGSMQSYLVDNQTITLNQ